MYDFMYESQQPTCIIEQMQNVSYHRENYVSVLYRFMRKLGPSYGSKQYHARFVIELGHALV